MQKMGLDYGEARIGVAFSDLLNIIATGYETYCRKGEEEDLKYLAELAKSKNVDLIVLGLPLQMDGEEGDRAVATRLFGDKLEKLSQIKVDYIDERLSSVEAEEMLKEAKMPWQERKKILDKISAAIILQNYLDEHSN